jgi:hypothetical protein
MYNGREHDAPALWSAALIQVSGGCDGLPITRECLVEQGNRFRA